MNIKTCVRIFIPNRNFSTAQCISRYHDVHGCRTAALAVPKTELHDTPGFATATLAVPNRTMPCLVAHHNSSCTKHHNLFSQMQLYPYQAVLWPTWLPEYISSFSKKNRAMPYLVAALAGLQVNDFSHSKKNELIWYITSVPRRNRRFVIKNGRTK